jgi:hypothetical protein
MSDEIDTKWVVVGTTVDMAIFGPGLGLMLNAKDLLNSPEGKRFSEQSKQAAEKAVPALVIEAKKVTDHVTRDGKALAQELPKAVTETADALKGKLQIDKKVFEKERPEQAKALRGLGGPGAVALGGEINEAAKSVQRDLDRVGKGMQQAVDNTAKDTGRFMQNRARDTRDVLRRMGLVKE